MKRLKKDNEAIRKAVATQLSMSDAVQTGDLLRFYTPNGLKPVDSSKISYTKQMDQLETDQQKAGKINQLASTSKKAINQQLIYSKPHLTRSYILQNPNQALAQVRVNQSQAALQRNNNNP